jgi:hypothetical protein
VAVEAALKFGGRKGADAELILDELGFVAERDRLAGLLAVNQRKCSTSDW